MPLILYDFRVLKLQNKGPPTVGYFVFLVAEGLKFVKIVPVKIGGLENLGTRSEKFEFTINELTTEVKNKLI